MSGEHVGAALCWIATQGSESAQDGARVSTEFGVLLTAEAAPVTETGRHRLLQGSEVCPDRLSLNSQGG
jgi:hypothetical protein